MISSIGTQYDLVQDAKTTRHPRRDSFMFISFHLSFYIISYKIPIKASVKLLGQFSLVSPSCLYLTHFTQNPINPYHCLKASLHDPSRFTRRPTDVTDRRHYPRTTVSLSV